MKENIYSVLNELKEKTSERIMIDLPSDDLIERYQQEIEMKFPDEYKIFLKNGMNIFYGTKDPLVITENGNGYGELKVALNEGRNLGIPINWLPICEDNGNYYCITPYGTVRYWSHDGPSDDEWDNLSSWIKDVWIDGN